VNTEAFPEYLIVAAAGKFDPGLAVSLQFGIIKKSTISFITFIFKSPITLTRDDLIERFDQIRNLLPKDYPRPKEAFDGTIEVKILSVAEIHDALKHFHVHARTMSFPAYYLQNLEAALQINPKSDCLVACEKVY
jgi:hypothetical protein